MGLGSRAYELGSQGQVGQNRTTSNGAVESTVRWAKAFPKTRGPLDPQKKDPCS